MTDRSSLNTNPTPKEELRQRRTASPIWAEATEDEREAQAAGCLFYHPPSLLDYDTMIDPLLRDACRAINSSGWMWTCETCQGHPDYDGKTVQTAWDHQVGPYFRIAVRTADVAWALLLLEEACSQYDIQDPLGFVQFKSFPMRQVDGPWAVLVFTFEAHNVRGRNAACEVLTRFGRAVQMRRDNDLGEVLLALREGQLDTPGAAIE